MFIDNKELLALENHYFNDFDYGKLKKMDEQDFEFITKPLIAWEEKEFSDFLKDRKSKTKVKRTLTTKIRPKEALA